MPSLFLNNFTVLDLAFASAEKGVQGDSFYVSAELFGDLDQKDFLFDFSPAKKALKELVDNSFDHKLLVPAALATTRADGLTLRFSNGESWEYSCPRSAYELLPEEEISGPVLETHLARIALTKMPANVRNVKFRLSTVNESAANFRYTHGLRYHDGNCQRLLHGHRNPIEVWVDGERSFEWEARLAYEWNGAHFVCAATLENRSELDLPLGVRQWNLPGLARISYTSSQGAFSASMPASRVVLTEAEPSIETMSTLAVERLKAWGLSGKVKVLAYEGLNKGAASEA